MKRQKLTPRNERKKVNRSISPNNGRSKSNLKKYFPSQKPTGKQNDCNNKKEEKSLKICLDLASYHQKQSEMLKSKNMMLEEQIQEQMNDMKELKNQLNSIKSTILAGNNQKKQYQQLKAQYRQCKKQNQEMKVQVNQLVAQNQELNQQISRLRAQGKETQSIFIDTNSKCDNFQISPLSFAKQSRRQELANKYQSISFVPSVVCLECKRKDNELEQAKNKYSQELRNLQRQVSEMQRSQTAVEVMQKQLISKNQCIDYLVTQLNMLENDSKSILQNMGNLQVKLRDVTAENVMLKVQTQPTDRLYSSYTKSMV